MSEIDPNNSIKKSKKMKNVDVDKPIEEVPKPKSKPTIRQFDNQYKIISILLVMFAILLFLALISYTTKDEVNAQITFKELLQLAFGNDEIEAKAATTINWLGIFGAFLANFLINNTIGYAVYLFPIFIIVWSRYLFTGKKIPVATIRRTYIFLILSIIFAGTTASMQKLSMFSHFEKELSGSIGQYISALLISIVGMAGTLILFFTSSLITIVVGFNLNISIIWKKINGLWNTMTASAEEAYSSFKEDVKSKNEEKNITAKVTTNSEANQENPSTEQENNINKAKTNSDEKVIIGFSNDNDERPQVPTPFNIIRKPIIRNTDDVVVGTGLDLEKSNHNKNITDIGVEKVLPIVENNNTPPNQVIPKVETKSEVKEQNNLINEELDEDESELKSVPKIEIIKKVKPEEPKFEDKPILKEPPIDIDVTKISPSEKTEFIPKESDLEDSISDIIEKEKPINNTKLVENSIKPPIKQVDITINKTISRSSAPANVLGTYIHDEEITYKTPGRDLLNNNIKEVMISDDELKTNAQILQEKLETFKIYIENLQITPGPVVTQYEFVPAAGIKISKIESLADDLAMALKAKGIRIIAPIPGKGTVGIEIPNAYPSMVLFSEIVNSVAFAKTTDILPLALGKTISGDIYILDMTKMPHLLIAGSTGAGKSVGINTIIASLLYKMHPSELKFVLIDPKKVELQQYAQLRDHFLAVSPDIRDWIITKPEDAVSILKSAVVEMEQRYDILAKAGQRNVFDYNKKVVEGRYSNDKDMIHRKLPYIVIIIDELADLMLTASKEIEEPITRLAQMARAVGIHLIVATQRPSVDVITGLIKANFPARIAYLVASKIDSRTILDMQGAEQLLGKGDMLCLPAGKPKPDRVQNAFIDTDEVENLCEFIGKQKGYSEPYYLPSLNAPAGERRDLDPDDRDPLFEDAAKLVILQQQASASMIQRRLRVGYARAGRLIDELEAYGVIGPFNGSNARLVLMESESDLERIM